MTHCHLSADGIGDAICAMYACAGFAAMGGEITFHTRHPEWLARLSTPGVTVLRHDAKAVGHSPGCDLSACYEEHLVEAKCRKQWYADNLMKYLGSAPIRPVPPVADASCAGKVAVERDPYVVLSPFAAHPVREWPLVHWTRLAWLLIESGYHVISLSRAGHAASRDRHRQAMTGPIFRADQHVQIVSAGADGVSDLIAGAVAFAGGDTGLTHLAGALGVPTVAMLAGLPGEMLFSHTSVVSVQSDDVCSPCRYQPAGGYQPHCRSGCSALNTVAPSLVLAAIERARGLTEGTALKDS